MGAGGACATPLSCNKDLACIAHRTGARGARSGVGCSAYTSRPERRTRTARPLRILISIPIRTNPWHGHPHPGQRHRRLLPRKGAPPHTSVTRATYSMAVCTPPHAESSSRARKRDIDMRARAHLIRNNEVGVSSATPGLRAILGRCEMLYCRNGQSADGEREATEGEEVRRRRARGAME